MFQANLCTITTTNTYVALNVICCNCTFQNLKKNHTHIGIVLFFLECFNQRIRAQKLIDHAMAAWMVATNEYINTSGRLIQVTYGESSVLNDNERSIDT